MVLHIQIFDDFTQKETEHLGLNNAKQSCSNVLL